MKKTISLLCLSGLFLFFYGCKTETKQTHKRIDPKELARKDSLALKIAVMPTMDCLPFFIAKGIGIYDSLRLQVQFKMYKAQMDCDTAFERGRVEGSIGDLIRAAHMLNKKTDLRVVMATNSEWFLVTTKGLRIKKTEQIDQRIIAIARNSVPDYFVDRLLEKENLKNDAVYRPQINDISLRGKMVMSNQLDAGILPEPQATLARLEKNRILVSSNELNINMGCLYFSDKSLKNKDREEQIKLLVKGYNLAVKLLSGHKVIKLDSILSLYYKLDKNVLDSIKTTRYTTASLPAETEVKNAFKWLQQRNLIHKKYNENLVDPRFINK